MKGDNSYMTQIKISKTNRVNLPFVNCYLKSYEIIH
jgi:hypothetical protein